MTTEQVRVIVSNAYPGDAWKKKVKNMTDQQVMAIYFRLQRTGVVK